MQSAEINIPETEITIDFVRSSGPGGQNVNKVSSKAQLRWNVGASAIFSEEEKARIREKLKGRLSKYDEIIISSDEERSQVQNKEKAVALLQTLVRQALIIPKTRIPTRLSRNKKAKRLDEKVRHSQLKKERKRVE
ncbi:MAG: hypothetical protein A2754_00575 [Candidatus Magasanikbacteria bacterium RIFCSPHIGHO2_01_FULL_47_8]|uniref:Prokaryotic-type class I peptide chain release factors domain-containing protein n=1 Tax=Candidatus Magasanikbacteria bacterium RIFCSPHIGHO2_01_FULL_47_8 TaxID=1798673 RepID=A0A1F6MCM8_9BACT|nr:MAG: hypothetical protein A2754_00575 [Candidatus Magasanikbacteria bacterium RIFCSPHIGHO2_01_FULL_47_8]